ncbi:MAG TPA: hypothetical protein VFV45_05060 [Rubrobacteraceae bacterium]|nr:hypothetical protein [Rubrobacteraceae bacterium]
MQRRTFLGALAALSSASLAPPIRLGRAAVERLRTRFWAPQPPRWGQIPPVAYPDAYPRGNAKVVARIYRAASQTPTLVTDGFFEAAMHDIPERILS